MGRYIAVDSILARWYRTSVRGRTEFDQVIANIPSIDLEADYVPKDFHDKTCEAMAKRHQEEIANILERADVDRPQGEWKSVKASIYPYGYDAECSVCGHRMGSSFGYKFCPMCGAQMKGADDECL